MTESWNDDPASRVALYEEMFKDRYTDQDEGFVKTLSTSLPDPPCIDNWFVRPKRDFQRGGYRGSGRGRDDFRNSNRDRGHQSYHDRRDNRHYGGCGKGHYGGREQGQGFDGRYHGNRDHRYQDRYHPYNERNPQYHHHKSHSQGQGHFLNDREYDNNR